MDFLIQYECLNYSGGSLKKGTMRVKNKANEFDAKTSLEKFLKKNNPTMDRLIIRSCKEDILGTLFNFLKR